MKIFNPQNGQNINYQATFKPTSATATISVYNTMGQVVYTETISTTNTIVAGKLTLNQALPKGLYLVQFTTGNQKLTQHLTIN